MLLSPNTTWTVKIPKSFFNKLYHVNCISKNRLQTIIDNFPNINQVNVFAFVKH